VDVLQPDVTWIGGLTEARRVVAMAAAYDIPVIPHGSSVYSYHLQFAFHNCPIAELINLSPDADKALGLPRLLPSASAAADCCPRQFGRLCHTLAPSLPTSRCQRTASSTFPTGPASA